MWPRQYPITTILPLCLECTKNSKDERFQASDGAKAGMMTYKKPCPDAQGATDDNPPRVTFISQWYAPEMGDGGIPRGIATGLHKAGYRVDVLTGVPNYPEGRLYPGYRMRPYQLEVRDGLPVHRAPLYLSHDTSGVRRAANYVTFALASAAVALTRTPSTNISLVYSSPITTAIPALALKWFRRTPYVLLIQDMWPESVTASGFLSKAMSRRLEPMLRRFCDFVYRHAAQIAVISPGMVDLLAARGVPLDKLHFVPNWADEQHYYPTPRSLELRRELAVTRRFTVMYAGNIGEMQGLKVVIDAATLIRDRTDIGFHIMGQGAAEATLRAIAAERRLDNVSFLAPQPVHRMADILAAVDVQLVSLKDEPIFHHTLPSKVQSLLAAGCVILGVVAGDAAEVIRASGAGSVVAPGSARELADRIVWLSEQGRQHLQDCRIAARRYYVDHFARSSTISALDALVSAAIHSRDS